jgi:anthranilate phosphoribosyltransferase
LELCIRVDLSDYNTIDLCGTGGDEKTLFSTLAFCCRSRSKVAKHGNYGVSISGSSNDGKLGIKFSDDADFLNEASIKLVFVFYMLLYFTLP